MATRVSNGVTLIKISSVSCPVAGTGRVGRDGEGDDGASAVSTAFGVGVRVIVRELGVRDKGRLSSMVAITSYLNGCPIVRGSTGSNDLVLKPNLKPFPWLVVSQRFVEEREGEVLLAHFFPIRSKIQTHSSPFVLRPYAIVSNLPGFALSASAR